MPEMVANQDEFFSANECRQRYSKFAVLIFVGFHQVGDKSSAKNRMSCVKVGVIINHTAVVQMKGCVHHGY